jgi:hypothetical protein
VYHYAVQLIYVLLDVNLNNYLLPCHYDPLKVVVVYFPYLIAVSYDLLCRTNLMKLRSDYKDEFVTKHGVKLGLMSCFVKVFASLRRCKAFAPYFYVAG